jgi:uncharacterized OsmC-like protein
VIRRIHAVYRFSPGQDVDKAVVDRVLNFHAAHCPVARSIGGSIDITTEVIYS